jgi:hypothetical protein
MAGLTVRFNKPQVLAILFLNSFLAVNPHSPKQTVISWRRRRGKRSTPTCFSVLILRSSGISTKSPSRHSARHRYIPDSARQLTLLAFQYFPSAAKAELIFLSTLKND